jgi:serine/threonine protein phosphatase PrpC
VNKKCFIANVGDSRALLSQNNGQKIINLSQDHKPNLEVEMKRIQNSGGQIYQYLSNSGLSSDNPDSMEKKEELFLGHTGFSQED